MSETAALTIEIFSDKVGDTFVIEEVDFPAVELVLDSLTPLRNFANLQRLPVSLVFATRGVGALDQRTYSLRHPELGLRAIFLVPVGMEGDSFRYEAIFN